MTDPSHPLCLNCKTPLTGKFCAKCGQEDKAVTRFFPELVGEALENVFAFNSRTARTLVALGCKPGHLSRAYQSGRRVSYLPPIRLFLLSSLGFFLILSVELFITSITSDFAPPALQLRPNGTVVTTSGEIAAVSQADFVGPRRLSVLQGFDLAINGAEGQTVPQVAAEFIDQIELPFISAVNNERLQEYLKTQARININEIVQEPMAFLDQLLEYLPVMVLLFIPLLALAQKIIYLGSGRYYVEHLVLVIHNQSFLFSALIVLALLRYLAAALPITTGLAEPLGSILRLWIVIYLFLSFKHYFQESWLKTTIRFVLVAMLFLTIVLTGLLLFLIIEFFIY